VQTIADFEVNVRIQAEFVNEKFPEGAALVSRLSR